jgi:Fanconi-associated nuclease 1
MVLKPHSGNINVGRKVAHPLSTNFDDDLQPPAAKRLKTLESTDGEESRHASDDENSSKVPRLFRDEIPDSEDDGDDLDERHSKSARPTDLESALPPIKTDKEAIAEYEAMRASEKDDKDALTDRLKDRAWTKGKSSIYVDAFNLALETVLQDEGHLFDEKEQQVFSDWRGLDYESQYLYVRLFLRKTSTWHRISKLGYFGDIADLPAAAKILQTSRPLPDSSAPVQVNPGELSLPEGTVLESSFRFADCSEQDVSTMEEASSLLQLDELKAFAKEAKVQGKNKADLLKALRRMSQQQSGLGWTGLKRSESQASLGSESGYENDDGNESPGTVTDQNRDGHFLRKIMALTGPCIRLSLPTLKLFERVHLVFYRSTEWTDKSLTTIILARISRRNFPDYIVCRSTNIFPTRGDLLEFEAALRTQFRVDNILEFNGNPGKGGLDNVLSIFEEVYPRWKVLLAEEQRKEDRVYESGEGAYLRRFSPAWVYTRIIHKGMYVLGRFKMHEREHAVTTELLNQQLFHAARRGAWYQRKALLEEHYMYALQPPAGVSDLEKQKRHWKRISLMTCEEGLQDRDCHTIYHYDLQKRIKKLEKQIKLPKREQHDFGHVLLSKPTEITVEGIQIKKEYPPTRRRSNGAILEERQRSTKTIWVDEAEGGGECSVEAMCLSWYRSQGMKGYHAEGGIIRTLFAYLFCDILFIYIPNVFQTPYQTCPLDLHTDAFYPSRASEINHRLVEIANGEAERLIREVYDREQEKKTCIIGLSWDFELDDLLEIVGCFDGTALATICKVMAQEYRVRGGGIPDLFLWDSVKKEVKFSEVKSENDRLSDTQRLWIHVLTGAGIRVELCNAVAKEVKVVKAE